MTRDFWSHALESRTMPRKATRPYNELDAERVLACLRGGLSLSAACERAGVHSADFNCWRLRDNGLRGRVVVAVAEGNQLKQDERMERRRLRDEAGASRARRLSEAERLRQYMEAQTRAGRSHYFVLTLEGRRCAHCGRSKAGAMPGYCEPRTGVFTTSTAGWLDAVRR